MNAAVDKSSWLKLSILILAWLLFTWEGWFSAAQIWWNNEIFNHGFLIIPGAAYFIFSKRHAFSQFPKRTTLKPLILIVPVVLLYVIGTIGEVKLFQHVATFALLPLLIWTIWGNRLAKYFAFPLIFILFCIPVGEQLIPWLQHIAADGAVFLLNISGIPLYRNGLYIEIPQGRFLVAEACSGVSFFIASLVIGSSYSHLNFASTTKKLAFFIVSGIFPIVANVIRVYGIIYIAYLTDMEYAAGADHLIYGWFFFALVLICLLGIGEFFRDATTNKISDDSNLSSQKNNQPIYKIIVTTVILSICSIWPGIVERNDNVSALMQPEWIPFVPDGMATCLNAPDWKPKMRSPNATRLDSVKDTNCSIWIYQAWFNSNGNELVTSLNRVFDPDQSSIREKGQFSLEAISIPWLELATINDEVIIVAHGYWINGKVFTSNVEAKMYQIYLGLIGGKQSGTKFIVVAKDNSDRTIELLKSKLKNIGITK